jgi:hypothetical protein
MAKNQLIKLNGIDVSSKRIRSRTEYLYQDQIDMAVIELRIDVNDLTTISKFQEVTIWENYSGTLEIDSNRKFSGNIAKIEREVGKITITAYSFLWKAIQSEANQTFDVNIDTEAGVGSEIFITLATLANITADSTSVESTIPTGIVLDKYVCNRAEVFERMQTLADIYAYQFFERYDTLKLYFQPLGFDSNTNIIQIGGENNNVQGFPKWKEDSSKLFNKVEIIGAYQEVRTIESFNGDTSTTTFNLTEEPEIVEVVVDDVLQIGGTQGATATFDYLVDKTNKQIIFQTGSIPGTGTDNIVIDYSYRSPRPVVQENETSISELGRTIKNVFTFGDIQSVDDAERRADNLLAIYSDEFVTTKVKMSPEVVESYNLLVGQSITVIDNRQNINRVMVIKKIISRFPESDVEIDLGDKEIRIASFEYDASLRLKRLEEEQSRTGDFIVAVKTPKHTLLVDRRDLDVAQQDYDTSSGYSIWGLGTADGFFDWGSGKWGTHSDAFLDEVEHTISQGSNIYNETFIDISYKDTVNTTSTWTGTGSVTFTANQIAQSTSIDANNGNISTARLTSTEVNGSFDYELTADYLEPLAHYKMNDNLATTNVIDSMGNYTGTLIGGDNTSDISVPGKINEALDLNGIDDKITTNFRLGDVSSSFSLWVKPKEVLGRFAGRIYGSNSNTRNGSFAGNSSLFRYRVVQGDNTTNAEAVDTDTYTLNQWYHVVGVISKEEQLVKIYVDGVLKDTTPFDGTLSTGTSVMEFGNSMDSGNIYYNLEIDDSRVFDSVLTLQQIQNIYNSGNGTEETNANWETVTNGTKHFFTNQGADLRFRATENSASTGEIENLKVDEYH